jgi:hypothetical protein
LPQHKEPLRFGSTRAKFDLQRGKMISTLRGKATNIVNRYPALGALSFVQANENRWELSQSCKDGWHVISLPVVSNAAFVKFAIF